MYALCSDPPARISGQPVDIDAADPSQTLTRDACDTLFRRIVGMTTGGGETSVTIQLTWQGYLRWGRNHPTAVGLTRSRRVQITRTKGTNQVDTDVADVDDAALKTAVAKVDGYLQQSFAPKGLAGGEPLYVPGAQSYLAPSLWNDSTAKMTAQERSDTIRRGVEAVRAAKLWAAGYAEARVVTWAILNTKGLAAYAVATGGQFSQTVRNPEGTGSGWAGMMHPDWTKLNVDHLSAISLQKCLASANPRAVEPGRYVAILEPQAVGSALAHAVDYMQLNPASQDGHPYHDPKGRFKTKLGERIMDERLTITSDPMDPDAPFLPFDADGYAYRKTTWVEKGVLKMLAYERGQGNKFNDDSGAPLPNPTAFRVSVTGEQASLEEMIATTERGLLVTRFGMVTPEYEPSILLSTVTRDGLWLIEKGKIKFPVKNMRVLDSPLFYCNSVLQLGKPERIFGARWTRSKDALFGGGRDSENFTPMALGNLPMVVPAMKVRDFNFHALADAV